MDQSLCCLPLLWVSLCMGVLDINRDIRDEALRKSTGAKLLHHILSKSCDAASIPHVNLAESYRIQNSGSPSFKLLRVIPSNLSQVSRIQGTSAGSWRI